MAELKLLKRLRMTEAQIGGARSAEDIWKIYHIALTERLHADVTFPRRGQAIRELPSEFLDNMTYAEWIVASYILKGIENFSDIIRGDVSKTIDEFLKIKDKKDFIFSNEINSYCGLVGCDKIKKGINVKLPGLSDTIVKYHGAIFEGETLRIYAPKTQEDACKQGEKTKWCTASKKANMFSVYIKQGPIYIIIPKSPGHPKEKYQFEFYTNSYMNQDDKRIVFYDFMTKYQESLDLIKTGELLNIYQFKYSQNILKDEPLLFKLKNGENYVYARDYDKEVYRPAFIRGPGDVKLTLNETFDFIYRFKRDLIDPFEIAKAAIAFEVEAYFKEISDIYDARYCIYDLPTRLIDDILSYLRNAENTNIRVLRSDFSNPEGHQLDIVITKGIKNVIINISNYAQETKNQFSNSVITVRYLEYKEESIGIKTLDGWVHREDGPAEIYIEKNYINAFWLKSGLKNSLAKSEFYRHDGLPSKISFEYSDRDKSFAKYEYYSDSHNITTVWLNGIITVEDTTSAGMRQTSLVLDKYPIENLGQALNVVFN